MRHVQASLALAFGLLIGMPGYGQNKPACELVSEADAEAILGVTLLPPKPTEPFRSLLDPDFTSGTLDQGCRFANFIFSYSTPKEPRPAKVIDFLFEVRYSSAPDPGAVAKVRKEVDTRTRDNPTDLPGLGDAAFWIGQPASPTLFVFVGGTKRLMIGPSNIGLEQEKALALKALASLGAKGNITSGTQPANGTPFTAGLKKPVLAGPNATGLDKLKRELTPKAEGGNANAQLALAGLYKGATIGADGNAIHDYAGAAYWYKQASDRGNPAAAYQLALLYDGVPGVPADEQQKFQLLQKSAQAGYVPAMSPLSDLYAQMRTPTSRERATYWAQSAADAGDSYGWLTLGIEYSVGLLGGDPPFWPRAAMEAYRKSAAGGNCEAMLQIADLYQKGQGVAANAAQAQSWTSRASTCFAGDLEKLRLAAAQYRARAANAREGAFGPIFPPVPPKAPVAASEHTKYAFDVLDPKVLAGITAVSLIAIALARLAPDDGSGGAVGAPVPSGPVPMGGSSSPAPLPKPPCHPEPINAPSTNVHGVASAVHTMPVCN